MQKMVETKADVNQLLQHMHPHVHAHVHVHVKLLENIITWQTDYQVIEEH